MLSPRKGAEAMMKVGVQLKDTDFARALVRGLSAEGRNLCFAFVDDFAGDEGFDLVLTDQEERSSRYVLLVKDPEETRIYDGSPYRIFRYTNARDFVSGLLYIYHRETGRNLEFAGDTRCKILVFASVSGEPDATAIALATGELLDKHFGCRCLYLNLCPIDGSKRFLPDGSGHGFLKLLYYLSQERDFPLSSFIRQYFQKDYIDISFSNPYFDELDSLRLHRLLKKIDELGQYDYLILDVGNHLTRGNKTVLAQAEEIVLVSAEENRLPAPFFQKITDLLERLGGQGKVRLLSLDRQRLVEREQDMPLGEDGLLDLSALKYIQWEAGRLVRNLMEQSDDD